jgi:Ca-activated chloride channel homolog
MHTKREFFNHRILGRFRRHDAFVHRHGAVIPLFAILLPVLLILAAFGLNVAYMQLTRTELRVATDAAARAGGRAFSEYQSVDQAKTAAQSTAALNRVGGSPLQLSTADDTDIGFGIAARTNNGTGRYSYTPVSTAAVRSLSSSASSLRILGRRTSGSPSGSINLPFTGFSFFGTFQPQAVSVATQVDRDIALILDRSGSMIDPMYDWDLYRSVTWQQQSVWNPGRRRWENQWVSVTTWTPASMETVYDTYNTQYNDYWYDNGPVPDTSRWKALDSAVDAFLDVLEGTIQNELVSVATFSSSARLDLELQSPYAPIRTLVGGTRPGGYTSIGAGIQTGMPSLISAFARPYAAKTIVVLTDGINNTTPTPQAAATAAVGSYNVTIHTVSLSDDADQQDMEEVATIGHGKHYHANEVAELVDVFEEIANNLPTVITQ